MMLQALNTAKHLFQTALQTEFSLPVSVEFGLILEEIDVYMMRQTTLDEFVDHSSVEPLWTDAVITLSPKILTDADTLHRAYVIAHDTIQENLKKGREWE